MNHVDGGEWFVDAPAKPRQVLQSAKVSSKESLRKRPGRSQDDEAQSIQKPPNRKTPEGVFFVCTSPKRCRWQIKRGARGGVVKTVSGSVKTVLGTTRELT